MLRTIQARRALLLKSNKRYLSLAHHVHQPGQGGDIRPPIVILHGLFGSKQNNRSISR